MNQELLNFLNDTSVNPDTRAKIAAHADETGDIDGLIGGLRRKYGRKYDDDYIPSNIQPETSFFERTTKFQQRGIEAIDKGLESVEKGDEIIGESETLGEKAKGFATRAAGGVTSLAGGISAGTVGAIGDALEPIIAPIAERLFSDIDKYPGLREDIGETKESVESYLKESPFAKAMLDATLSLTDMASLGLTSAGGKQIGKQLSKLELPEADVQKPTLIDKKDDSIVSGDFLQKKSEDILLNAYGFDKKSIEEISKIFPGSPEETKRQAAQYLQKRGFDGSPEESLKQVGDKLGKVMTIVDDAFEKGNDVRFPLPESYQDIRDIFEKVSKEKGGSGELKNEITDMYEMLKTGNMSLPESRAIKQVYEQYFGKYPKEGKGYTQLERTSLNLTKEFKELAEQYIPNIKDLHKDIQMMHVVQKHLTGVGLYGDGTRFTGFDDALLAGSLLHPGSLAVLAGKKGFESKGLKRSLSRGLKQIGQEDIKVKEADFTKAPVVRDSRGNIIQGETKPKTFEESVQELNK